jgi:hypothetical protein
LADQSVEKESLCRADGSMPIQLLKTGFELRRFVKHLHNPESATIVQFPFRESFPM